MEPEAHVSLERDREDRSKRRKIRKGTQSCWECKRRKIRCNFDTSQDATTCKGCRRRGTVCVSQDLPDVGVQTSTNDLFGKRLERIEKTLEQVLCAVSQSYGGTLNDEQPNRSDCRGMSSTPERSFLNQAQTRISRFHYEGLPLHSQPSRQNENTQDALLAAWPSQRDLEMILNAMGKETFALDYLSCHGRNSFGSPHLRIISQLSSVSDCHPILMVQQLLALAFNMQALTQYDIETLSGIDVDCQGIRLRAIETAATLLGCSDELRGSIEGIECLVIAGMYYNNEGDLRRSWLTIRQAITHAQMMGLQKGEKTSLFESPQPDVSFSPRETWFRLIYIDGYLSMMLGLPPGSSDSTFANEEALDLCTPDQQFQRIVCLAACRILQRDSGSLPDLELTRMTDHLFQKAAALMQPMWWILPDFSPDTARDQLLQDTLRVFDHLTYFHLLTRLHLPYLLWSSNDPACEYSKSVVTFASREVLLRYIALSKYRLTVQCCQVLDYLVFFASTLLCFTRIIGNCQSAGFATKSNDYSPHQRLSDRALLEQVQTRAESMISDRNSLYSRVGNALRHLLVFENDALAGWSYQANFVPSRGEELQCGTQLSEDGNKLYLYMPTIGTVEITCDTFHLASNQYDSFRDVDGIQAVKQNSEACMGGLNLEGIDVQLYESLMQDTDWAAF